MAAIAARGSVHACRSSAMPSARNGHNRNGPRRHRFRPGVGGDPPAPGRRARAPPSPMIAAACVTVAPIGRSVAARGRVRSVISGSSPRPSPTVIEELWMRAAFRLAHAQVAIPEVPAQGRGWTLAVSHDDRLRGANGDAGGLETAVDAVRAEVTFLRALRYRIDVDRVVGAGVQTGLAADADGPGRNQRCRRAGGTSPAWGTRWCRARPHTGCSG